MADYDWSKMSEYSAEDIAKYVIFYCHEHRYPINNLKLQKLLYFVQAYFLVEANKSCFYDVIEAWGYGPVIPVVYRKYRVYGSLNIPCLDDGSEFNYIKSEDYDILNTILDEVAKYDLSQLVNITCNQSPWIDARKTLTKRITNKSIVDFFK